MPFTAVTVQQPGVSGAALTFGAVDASNGNKVPNDGATFIEIVNGDSNPTTVTIATVDEDGYAVANQDITVAAGARKHAGPFKMKRFTQPSGANRGHMELTFSNGTSVTMAAFH